jgi:hypothetical protein
MVDRLAPALLTTMLLGGCASPSSDDAVAPRIEVSPPSTSTLIVATTYRHDSSWHVYREGAKAEIILRDDTGKEVDIRTVDLGRSVRFKDLPPGEYELEPATRPCDGNCGYLDPRVDVCTGTVEVTRTMQVRVSFVVAAPCTVHSPAAAKA